jgi:hypothetical protein
MLVFYFWKPGVAPMFSRSLTSGLIQVMCCARAWWNTRCTVTRYLRDPPVMKSNNKKKQVEQKRYNNILKPCAIITRVHKPGRLGFLKLVLCSLTRCALWEKGTYRALSSQLKCRRCRNSKWVADPAIGIVMRLCTWRDRRAHMHVLPWCASRVKYRNTPKGQVEQIGESETSKRACYMSVFRAWSPRIVPLRSHMETHHTTYAA